MAIVTILRICGNWFLDRLDISCSFELWETRLVNWKYLHHLPGSETIKSSASESFANGQKRITILFPDSTDIQDTHD
jgi:hypothetical protein